MGREKAFIILAHAFTGRAPCAATMGIDMATMSLQDALVVYATRAPVFFAIISLIYLNMFNSREGGGSPASRDKCVLESALMRSQIGYYQDIIEESTAFMESLAMNHPFVDGNKRLAFFATDAFQRFN